MGWSKKYKKSIDCNNPKGFSQKAHCAGRKKKENVMSSKLEELVGKPITEEQFDEAAGKKDACYHKVKARYDVWPSAYASGALVKCRKVGAKNWGNKSKKEGLDDLKALPKDLKKSIKKNREKSVDEKVLGGKDMTSGIDKNTKITFSKRLPTGYAYLAGKTFKVFKKGINTFNVVPDGSNSEKDAKTLDAPTILKLVKNKHISKIVNSKGKVLNKESVNEGDIESRELKLYIDNDSQLYNSRFMPIMKNLTKKMKKGKFDKKLAIKGFMYLVDDGAKKYVKDHGGNAKEMFSKKDRIAVASDLADEFEDAYKNKEYSFMEGFASDAQRKAAFASGYKAKGKKKKKEGVNERKVKMTKHGTIHVSEVPSYQKDHYPTQKHWDYYQSLPKGKKHLYYKKYPEILAKTSKQTDDFIAQQKKELGLESVNEARVLHFTQIKDKTLEKHLKVIAKKVGATVSKISGGFKVDADNDGRKLAQVVDYVFDKSLMKGLMSGGGMSRVQLVNEESGNVIDEGLGDMVGKSIGKYNKKRKKNMDALKKLKKKESVEEARGTCWVGYQQKGMKEKNGRMVPNCVKETIEIFYEENGEGHGYTLEHIKDLSLNEAEYQGRKVKLGKIMQGDTKKFKVYVKNPKGNVVKVNFGQGGKAKGGTMRIRKSNPKARANFRARHNCDNPGPRHKARYWSCRKW